MAPPSRPRELSNDVRAAVYLELLEKWNSSKHPHGTIKNIANRFEIARKTVSKYWKMGKDTESSCEVAGFLRSCKKGTVGRKKYPIAKIESALRALPHRRRRTVRHAARDTGIPYSALFRAVKAGLIKRRGSKLRPVLTVRHRMRRLGFALSLVYERTLKFDAMYDRLFVDEKWFYLNKTNFKELQTNEEEAEYRTIQSRRYILTVMFLTAVARPRLGSDGSWSFSGKIGVLGVCADG